MRLKSWNELNLYRLGDFMGNALLCIALLFAVYGLATALINVATWLLTPKNNYKDIIIICLCGHDAYSDLYFSYNRIKTDYGKKVRPVVIDCGITDQVQHEYCREYCTRKGIPLFKRSQFPEKIFCGI